jgi:CRP-like cAMP-binding protein
LRGQVEFRQTDSNGKVRKIAKIGEGQMFGDIALSDNRPRAAAAVALKPTEAYRVTKEEFTQQLSTMAPAIQYLTESLARRVRGLVDDLLRKQK